MEHYALSVIKIKNILMVTIPADPDDHIVNMMQENILQSFEKHQSRGVIMDVSMVETMDSFFARIITETAHMVELMGGTTVIAGMTASVAITTTQLGLSIGNALTALNVDKALEKLNQIFDED